jgi:hypothetical protein
MVFSAILFPILTELAEEYSKVLLYGDFNIDLLSGSRKVLNFTDCLSSLGYAIINNRATNFVDESQTLIDLTITNYSESIVMSSQVLLIRRPSDGLTTLTDLH